MSDYRSSIFDRLFTLVEQRCALERRCYSPPTIDDDGRASWNQSKDGGFQRYVEAEELRVEINYVFDEILACVTGEHWPRLGLKERLQTLALAIESLHMWKEGIEKRDSVTADECRAWLERKIEETQIALDRLRPVAEQFSRDISIIGDGPQDTKCEGDITPAYLGITLGGDREVSRKVNEKEYGPVEFDNKKKPWDLFDLLFKAGKNGIHRRDLEDAIGSSLDKHKKTLLDLIEELELDIQLDLGMWTLTHLGP